MKSLLPKQNCSRKRRNACVTGSGGLQTAGRGATHPSIESHLDAQNQKRRDFVASGGLETAPPSYRTRSFLGRGIFGNALALTLGITATTGAAAPSDNPKSPIQNPQSLNVLLFTADDMGWFSVAAMHSPAHTPDVTSNIDRFATQSMAFQRAHVTVAICQPSRGALGTGMYPHVSGVEGFNPVPRPTKTVMSEFRDHGYRTGILGKCMHSTPDASFVWDMRHDTNELGHGRNPQKYADYFREFVRDCKKAGKPFYFMCNSHDPHRPFCGAERDLDWRRHAPDYPLPSRVFKPSEIVVPGFLPALPEVREEMAQYCSSARRCDDTFGAVMQVLDEEGLAGNTLVVFLSDNGMSAPFSKSCAYYNSTRTPLLVRLPGVTKPGSTDDAHFVSGIDYMPTVLDACGFTPPAGLNGRSFLPLLRGEPQEGRERVFTQFYENAGPRRYPMFTVQDASYILIYNPWSDGKYGFWDEPLSGLSFPAMSKAARTDAFIRSRVKLMRYRVPLELYDIQKDPDALRNLATDPAHADVLRRMSAQLKDWMKQYDPTPLPAFASFPSEKERGVYMTAQLQIAASIKAAKSAAKTQKGKTTKADDSED